MGLFTNLKSALGIGIGTLEVELGPPARLGEDQTGVLRFAASKSLKVQQIGVRLNHRFFAEGLLDQLILDELSLVEMAAFAESETVERKFSLMVPFEAAPTAPGFSWQVEAFVLAQGHDPLVKKIDAPILMSVVGGGVHHVLTTQFGFKPKQWSATEDGLFIDYDPDASVGRHFTSLKVLYDEDERELTLGVELSQLSPSARNRYADRYDSVHNIVWLSLLRSDFDRSGADYQSLFAELSPLFALE